MIVALTTFYPEHSQARAYLGVCPSNLRPCPTSLVVPVNYKVKLMMMMMILVGCHGNMCYKQLFFHFLIVFPNRGNESGLECCYDNNGNLLIWPPAAGTADVVSPRNFNSPFLHYLHDLLPAIHCCRAPAASFSSCQIYYMYRPSDNCFRFNPNPPGINMHVQMK